MQEESSKLLLNENTHYTLFVVVPLLQRVMSVEQESTSCYCHMDSKSCHLLLDQPGSYTLVGEPVTQAAVKRLKVAVFGRMEAGSFSYSLRVYCVDDTPHAFQVSVRLILYFFVSEKDVSE